MISIPRYYDVWFYFNNEVYKERFYSKILCRKRFQYTSRAKIKPLLQDKRSKLHRCRNNC